MRRKIVLFLVSALLLTACGGRGGSVSTAPATGVTFSDSLGRTVTVDQPERVAALTGSFADIWCLAGGKDTLTAAAGDAWTSFDLGLDEDVVDLGGVKTPSLELLLSVQPDLVLASSNTAAQVELLETLEAMGLPVAYFHVTGFEDYLNMLDICTQITGQTQYYAQYGLALQTQIDAARAKADGSRPRVLYVRATGSSCKVKDSRDSVLGEMLADLDCVNVADSPNGLLEQLSLEVILSEDPDFVFAVLQGADQTDAERTLEQTLLSNPAWGELTAVQEGRFHILDDQLYNLKPNRRWGEAYEELAKLLYPDS